MGKLSIKIDSPCSEKWGNFEKKGINGFCQSCEKEVIDFTRMSESEIKNYFKNASGNVCGRMLPSQQKTYSTTTYSHSLKPLASTLMAASALLFTGTSTIAQSKDQTEQKDYKRNRKSKDISERGSQKRTITGKVTDESGETLPGVNIVIKGTTKGVQSDLDGHYQIEVNPSDFLIFSFIGFDTKEVPVGAKSIVDIIMDGGITELGGIALGGIQYRWYTPRGLWHRVRGLFWRIF